MPINDLTRDPKPASTSDEPPASASASEVPGSEPPDGPMPMPMPSDGSGNEPAMLTVAGERAVAEPIRVSNTLWSSTHEAAYGGGLPPAITHLRELELGNKRDDAPWSGALDIIPTKADYVLDLIRANSLWPLLSGLAC